MLKQVVRPLSYHKPPEKICEELKKGDAQICELQYGKCGDGCVQFSSGQILVEFFFINVCLWSHRPGQKACKCVVWTIKCLVLIALHILSLDFT